MFTFYLNHFIINRLTENNLFRFFEKYFNYIHLLGFLIVLIILKWYDINGKNIFGICSVILFNLRLE